MKRKAIRKVQKAIDAIIDLREDCNVDEFINARCIRLLDMLRDLESTVDNAQVKKGQLTTK
jgi:hypothetical protein